MRRALEFAKRFPWAMKCDIRRYFPSIDHRILRDQVARVIGDADVLALVDAILATHVERTAMRWPEGGELFDGVPCPQGLPIGNPHEPVFRERVSGWVRPFREAGAAGERLPAPRG